MDAREAQLLVYERLNKIYGPLYSFFVENGITPSFDFFNDQRKNQKKLLNHYLSDNMSAASELCQSLERRITKKIEKENIKDDERKTSGSHSYIEKLRARCRQQDCNRTTQLG